MPIRSKKRNSSSMQSVAQILLKFNPIEDKYISREFQSYGCYLCDELNDNKHRALYIKLAKTVPRALLERALSFTKDANVKRKGALFMWKLKELGAWKKDAVKEKKKEKPVADIPF